MHHRTAEGFCIEHLFCRTRVEDISYKTNLCAEIKEDLSKLRVTISSLNYSRGP